MLPAPSCQAIDLGAHLSAGKAWQILGLSHERLGTADGDDAAVRCYRRGTQEDPRVVGNWHNLALLLAQVGRWQASLDAANGGLVAVPVCYFAQHCASSAKIFSNHPVQYSHIKCRCDALLHSCRGTLQDG